MTWGAALRTATVAMMVKAVKMMRQRRSSTWMIIIIMMMMVSEDDEAEAVQNLGDHYCHDGHQVLHLDYHDH